MVCSHGACVVSHRKSFLNAGFVWARGFFWQFPVRARGEAAVAAAKQGMLDGLLK
jgi:hypothetical protein